MARRQTSETKDARVHNSVAQPQPDAKVTWIMSHKSEAPAAGMNEEVALATVAENRVITPLFIGAVALAYAASMIFQNGLFGFTGAPGYGDPIGVVLQYHVENQGTLVVTSGLEAVNMLLLL